MHWGNYQMNCDHTGEIDLVHNVNFKIETWYSQHRDYSFWDDLASATLRLSTSINNISIVQQKNLAQKTL